ncbi:MAG: hypothetical protein ACP5SB_00385 [Caldisericaceae bacterium]
MEDETENETYIVVGKRRLRLVEFSGDKPIDELLPALVKLIFDSQKKEDSNESRRNDSKL